MSLRIADFRESLIIQAPLSQVFAQLAQPERMLGLQPLLVHCEVVNQRADAESQITECEVLYTERFKILGPLHYDNHIRSFMKSDARANQITFTVRSFPRIKLSSCYDLSPRESHTHVELSLTIQAPAILAGFVSKIAHGAHRRLLAKLKQRCEAIL